MRQEAEGHAFQQPGRGQDPPCHGGTDLFRGERGRRHGGQRRHRDRLHVVQPVEAQHLLDQVGLSLQRVTSGGGEGRAVRVEREGLVERRGPGDVVAPGGDGDRYLLPVPPDRLEPEPCQGLDRGVRSDLRPAQRAKPGEPQARLPLPGGLLSGRDDAAGLAAAQLQDKARGGLDGAGQQGGVDAALEALASVRGDLMPPPGQRHAHRVEQRAFQEHPGGRLVAAGRGAAHDPGERLNARRVGDDAILRIGRVVLPVQRPESLARPGTERQRAARELGRVEDMQRPAEVDGEEVRHVHQGVDRPQPDRDQPVGQPFRAGPIAQTPERAAQNPGTGIRHPHIPRDRALERGRDRGRLPRKQRSHPGGGQVARDPAHRQRVAAVRRHRDVDHRVVQAGIGGVGRADRRVLGQLDDAVMVLAEAHFAKAEQHAGALDAADLAHFQGDAGAGDERAGRGEHRLHAGPRVRRPADDRHQPVARIHGAGAQPVRVRVLRRLDHVGDPERGEGGAAVLYALQFQADGGQPVGDGGERRVGVQVRAQPGEGELHQTPSCSMAGASGRLP